MVRYWLLALSVFINCIAAAQLQQQLQQATQKLLNDAQLSNGSLSFCVLDVATQQQVFGHQPKLGLAPASSLKVVTTATALANLGSNFTFTTSIYTQGQLQQNTLVGNVYIVGNGDPSVGSWRWKHTTTDSIFARVQQKLHTKGIYTIKGTIYVVEQQYDYQPIPDGWIWYDIGNYYGAGSYSFNWRENQYDIILQPGTKVGDSVRIQTTEPSIIGTLHNKLTTGPAGSGDNTSTYWTPKANSGFIEGTAPLGEKNFTVSGSLPHPALTFLQQWQKSKFSLAANGYAISDKLPTDVKLIDTLASPTLAALSYWFMQKSINLYGEAFTKYLGQQYNKQFRTDAGIAFIKSFWKQQQIDVNELKIQDGSGLSPQNRVSSNALAQVLAYATQQSWYSDFYNALPLYNGMRMKSGTIGGSKAFAGIHTNKQGKTYAFAIIINNYNGSPKSLVEKMYQLLNVLK